MTNRYYIVPDRNGHDITDDGTPLRDTDLVDRLNEQGDDLRILERQMQELEANAVIMADALIKIRDTAVSWEGRATAPYWNLGDIAAAAIKKARS